MITLELIRKELGWFKTYSEEKRGSFNISGFMLYYSRFSFSLIVILSRKEATAIGGFFIEPF